MNLNGKMSFLRKLSIDGRNNELDADSGEVTNLKPKEFFWDNIVLFVTSAIIGIAAVEVVAEYIRGGDVSCFSPHGIELSEAQGAYINNFCAGYLPTGAYIPAFMVVHALLISLPHYLWLNHYGGNFDFFFHLASSLKRTREEGEHTPENVMIVSQLESTFSIYGRRKIFTLYAVKLLVQFVLSLGGVGFVYVFFFQNFDSRFMCPRFHNSTENQFWPFKTNVVCVFEALQLLHTLWWAEIGLLCLLCFSLFWALVWCFISHPTELGFRRVAQFSFQSGLAPTYYVPSGTGHQQLFRFFTSIFWFSFSGPRIRSDLDFLVMKLYRTDNGLGHVLKEVQIEKELKILTDDDQRRLRLHATKQKNFLANDVCERMKDLRDREKDEQDLRWQFTKIPLKKGIYRDFKVLPRNHQLLLPETMRGTVLGFGQWAPYNKGAMSISFGSFGYATSLARVFRRVASLNFSPDYNSSEEIGTITQYKTFVVSLVFPDNVLSSQTSNINKFIEKLQTIWVRPDYDTDFNATSFIVVGPIPKEKDFNITTVDLLFEHIYGCLEQGAVLLTVHPLEIAGKTVKDNFLSYEPSKQHFLPLRQAEPVIFGQPTEWPARNNVLQASQTKPPINETHGPSNEVPMLIDQSYRNSLVSVPADKEQLPFQFDISVRCGETRMKVRFSTYCYNREEKESIPEMFSPTKRRIQPVDQQVTATSTN